MVLEATTSLEHSDVIALLGQPQRGSTKDSWTEEADWAWSFAGDGPSLAAKLPKGKYFTQLRLSASAADGQYQLTAIPVEIGNLVILQYLRLDDNQLTSIPAEIGNFVNLTTLNLSDNLKSSFLLKLNDLLIHLVLIF